MGETTGILLATATRNSLAMADSIRYNAEDWNTPGFGGKHLQVPNSHVPRSNDGAVGGSQMPLMDSARGKPISALSPLT